MERKALVLGATGLIGTQLVYELIENDMYDEIVLLTRRKTVNDHWKVKEIIIDFNRMEEVMPVFTGKDVFCCLGTTRRKAGSKEAFQKVDYEYSLKAAKLTSRAGANKFLLISALGADKNSLFFYNKVKGRLEEAVKELLIPSIYIFRPSLLIGSRQEFRFGEKIAEYFSILLNPLLKGRMQKYKPIKARHAAKAMVHAAQNGLNGVHIIESDKM
ncbi:hypothetical protein AF332_22495 [Sporosarcina globispora]|uniref:NAD(P)-binding domain-containing protein n=1 Tax=Sporosarcina globispora TaxID=1459 RepID=A0A0M0GHB0_SPOGL|nr:oxidoreductase [Sporosarcina globispora]KON89305.1 hypothetical protein AF332_22495 [Sporosarcina globispora]